MATEILTTDDLKRFKIEFFNDFFKEFDRKIKDIIKQNEEAEIIQSTVHYIKSAQVMKMLRI